MDETQKTGPTPGPWKAVESGIYGPGDVEIAECQSEDGVEVDDANAAHIVKCVNAHDELVRLLEMAFDANSGNPAARLRFWEERAKLLSALKAGG